MGILIRNCPHPGCYAEHVSFRVVWSDYVPNKTRSFTNNGALCGACNSPICFVAMNKNTHEVPLSIVGNIEPICIVSEIWPQRSVPLAPPHTPVPVAKRFLEGEDAFGRRRWNSAVAMYRSALDIGTKGIEGVPKDVNFFQRLVWLHDHHLITPDMKAWADHVRVEGNAALHDPDEFAEDDAKALRFFTEMFLRYIFELPGAVKEFRKSTEDGAG